MQRIVFWAVAAWAMCCLVCDNWATAGLIVPPSSGTERYRGGDTTDFILKIDAWSNFGGKFFGRARSDFGDGIYVSEDGNINLTNDKNFFPNNPPYVPRIAPLWDDFLYDTKTTNRVTTHQSVGYIGATWENVKLSFELIAGNSSRSFQTLWFDQDTRIRGFDFKVDDIAFSYSGEVIRDSQPGGSLHASIVGLQSGGNPGTNIFLDNTRNGDGILFDGDAAKLGLGNVLGEDDFLLFRASGSSYTLTRQSLTAVPEPSSLLCVAIVLSLLSIFAAWRKRIAFRSSLDYRSISTCGYESGFTLSGFDRVINASDVRRRTNCNAHFRHSFDKWSVLSSPCDFGAQSPRGSYASFGGGVFIDFNWLSHNGFFSRNELALVPGDRSELQSMKIRCFCHD